MMKAARIKATRDLKPFANNRNHRLKSINARNQQHRANPNRMRRMRNRNSNQAQLILAADQFHQMHAKKSSEREIDETAHQSFQ